MNELHPIISGAYEVAVSKGRNPDSILVDAMTAFSPILPKLEWTKSNRQTSHSFREVRKIDGVGRFDWDGIMPRIRADFSMGSENLTAIGGVIEVGRDFAQQTGGVDAYLKESAVLFARELGMQLENAFYYRIHEVAVAKHRRWSCNATGTSAGTLAVLTPTPSECCALFSPVYPRSDEPRFFELEKLSGGATYLDQQGRAVYGAMLKSAVGLLLANERLFATLDGIDPSSANFDKKFPEMVSELLDEILINDKTIFVMNHKLKNRIANQFAAMTKANKLISFDDRFGMSIAGIKVVPSQNVPLSVALPTAETDAA